ncbi:unnamed protein product [Diplocarpon coronariae]
MKMLGGHCCRVNNLHTEAQAAPPTVGRSKGRRDSDISRDESTVVQRGTTVPGTGGPDDGHEAGRPKPANASPVVYHKFVSDRNLVGSYTPRWLERSMVMVDAVVVLRGEPKGGATTEGRVDVRHHSTAVCSGGDLAAVNRARADGHHSCVKCKA